MFEEAWTNMASHHSLNKKWTAEATCNAQFQNWPPNWFSTWSLVLVPGILIMLFTPSSQLANMCTLTPKALAKNETFRSQKRLQTCRKRLLHLCELLLFCQNFCFQKVKVKVIHIIHHALALILNVTKIPQLLLLIHISIMFLAWTLRLILRSGVRILALHAVLVQPKHIDIFQSLSPEL